MQPSMSNDVNYTQENLEPDIQVNYKIVCSRQHSISGHIYNYFISHGTFPLVSMHFIHLSLLLLRIIDQPTESKLHCQGPN